MTRGLGGVSPANVTHHLSGVNFPARKQDLVKKAKANGADRDILEMIEDMPDMDFENMADVMKAYGEADRGRGEQGGSSERDAGESEHSSGRGEPEGGGGGRGRSH
ncbi:DUF2795 domain-containing protein [Methylocystis bryophila]|uniref:DUF2795 domain-containing protein n=1 Tax=Methylocystis bryophila TaxID=655015 RepID=A0A1W6MQ86_9HYPH|nr:DUF2795 domain-containing protein [Methylocystis bryophila]ARN79760.1 hypothetical protein B1812_00285 [Methylocystis bryophila]BDV39634.1 hypothetical protein DSM21852_28870 [Methylocystis bryophila]